MDFTPFRAVAAVTISWASCVRKALGDIALMEIWAAASRIERRQIAAVLGVPSHRKISSLSNCNTNEDVERWLATHTPTVVDAPGRHQTLKDLTDEIVHNMVGTHVPDADLKCLQTMLFMSGGASGSSNK